MVTFLLVGMIWFFGVDVFNKKLKPSATSGRRPVCMCGFNKCSPENTFPQGLQSKLARDHLFFFVFFGLACEGPSGLFCFDRKTHWRLSELRMHGTRVSKNV